MISRSLTKSMVKGQRLSGVLQRGFDDQASTGSYADMGPAQKTNALQDRLKIGLLKLVN